MLSTDSSTFNTSSTPTSRLVALLGFILALGPSASNGSSSSSILISTLHVALHLVQCYHQLGPDLCAELLLDLRANCSAILVSWLLRIDHNIGFCGLHIFAQNEIEDVVFDIDWNELFSTVPTHLSFEMHPHFMTNVAAHWNHETTSSRIHTPLAVRWNLPSPAPPGPTFNGNVFTAAPVFRFIFTNSNRFGLLMAPRSKLPSEKELAQLSQVCSQNSCHPTELQSSFHSS